MEKIKNPHLNKFFTFFQCFLLSCIICYSPAPATNNVQPRDEIPIMNISGCVLINFIVKINMKQFIVVTTYYDK